jgi:hypothetical protein
MPDRRATLEAKAELALELPEIERPQYQGQQRSNARFIQSFRFPEGRTHRNDSKKIYSRITCRPGYSSSARALFSGRGWKYGIARTVASWAYGSGGHYRPLTVAAAIMTWEPEWLRCPRYTSPAPIPIFIIASPWVRHARTAQKIQQASGESGLLSLVG